MAKRKQLRATRVTAADKLKEPRWDGWEEWDGAQYHRFKQGTSSWYYHTFKPDELVKHTYEWMKQNGYSATEIKCAKAVPSYVIGTTTSINCRMLLQGMPNYNKKEVNSFLNNGVQGANAWVHGFLYKELRHQRNS